MLRRDPAARDRCAPVRESISALLDGEEAPLGGEAVDRHLEVCASCAAHASGVERVHRSVRVTRAVDVPDLTADVLLAVTEATQQRAGRRVRELRGLVALAGGVQLVLALPFLLGIAGPDLHVGRDLGALQLALGVGLLVAAWQPWRAAGVLPIAAVVAAITVIAGVVDVATGAATLGGELVHLSEVVGVAALWALRRRDPEGTGDAAQPLAVPAVPAR
jgi:predicted anti-sigma-YlaC factor YlaD